jgi:hypothetical protein
VFRSAGKAAKRAGVHAHDPATVLLGAGLAEPPGDHAPSSYSDANMAARSGSTVLSRPATGLDQWPTGSFAFSMAGGSGTRARASVFPQSSLHRTVAADPPEKCLQMLLYPTPSMLISCVMPEQATEEANLQVFQAL